MKCSLRADALWCLGQNFECSLASWKGSREWPFLFVGKVLLTDKVDQDLANKKLHTADGRTPGNQLQLEQEAPSICLVSTEGHPIDDIDFTSVDDVVSTITAKEIARRRRSEEILSQVSWYLWRNFHQCCWEGIIDSSWKPLLFPCCFPQDVSMILWSRSKIEIILGPVPT